MFWVIFKESVLVGKPLWSVEVCAYQTLLDGDGIHTLDAIVGGSLREGLSTCIYPLGQLPVQVSGVYGHIFYDR
jgi:hypothetical protein